MTFEKVVIGDATLIRGDCMEVLPTLGKVDCVLTDPPYFGVKSDDWDNQWKNSADFLSWMDKLVGLLAERMNANASMYLFASPQMAGRVESVIWSHLNVLGNLIWRKGASNKTTTGWHQKAEKESLRSFLFETERIIFAEKFGDQYLDAGKALHKDVFAPIGRYIQDERSRAGLTRNDIEVALGFVSTTNPLRGTALCYRWEEGSSLPTKAIYEKLRSFLNANGGDYLLREYEDLRSEYEDLRRPFYMTEREQWSDVWDFDAVTQYKGKHPCEKPQKLLAHILNASTKPDAIVLDAFNGSGATAIACMSLGRKYIGIEKDGHWFDYSCKRIEQAYAQGQLFAPVPPKQEQMSLEASA